MAVQNIVIWRSTIVYGHGNVPGFGKVKCFQIRESHIKTPEFVFKPLSDEIREMRLTGNDFYGVMAFNLIYHVNFFYEKFQNLRVLEFEG